MSSFFKKLFLILLLCQGGVVFAFTPPLQPDDYVTDKAYVLSSSEKYYLNQALSSYEAKTSNQIFIALFKTLDGESLEDVSIRLASQWKIGQKDKNNGVLLLVFIADRQLRIEVGYGLEDRLTDATASRIIRNNITPFFKTENYANGLIAGVKAIEEAIENPEQASQLNLEEEENLKNTNTFTPQEILKIVAIFIALLIPFFFIDFIRYFFYHRSNHTYRGQYTFWEWWFRFAISYILVSFAVRILLSILLNSGSNGGNSRRSGSGGGGSFGGGGASGRW